MISLQGERKQKKLLCRRRQSDRGMDTRERGETVLVLLLVMLVACYRKYGGFVAPSSVPQTVNCHFYLSVIFDRVHAIALRSGGFYPRSYPQYIRISGEPVDIPSRPISDTGRSCL